MDTSTTDATPQPAPGPPPQNMELGEPPERRYVPMQECPILIWMLSLNRDYYPDEYDACHEIVSVCVEHTRVEYNPEDPDTFRQIMMYMLPLLMMRHRRIPRSKWRDNINANGKHWIEQAPDNLPPEKFLYSRIGYHLAYDNGLCGMAMTQGVERKVVNIGLGLKQIIVEPRGVSVAAYAESLAHKLTEKEMASLGLGTEVGDDVSLSRLCMLLALKDAYIKAIGQPIGFDFSRLEFDIPNQKFAGDGLALEGWEFRVFKSQHAVIRDEYLVEESYSCVCAFFRGTLETKFIWYNSRKELDAWVQFLNIDQMLKVVTKLNA